MALGATGALGGTGLEAVLEAAVDVTQGAHAAAASGLAALGLLTPVDCSEQNNCKPVHSSEGLILPSSLFLRAHPTLGEDCVHLRVLADG